MSQEHRLPRFSDSPAPGPQRVAAGASSGQGRNLREDPRKDLDTQAFVSVASLPTRAYAVREISRGGMFLGFRDPRSTRQELEQNGIDREAPVDIAFVVTRGDTKDRFSVRAKVRRITRDGLGVAFLTHNPPQLAALRDLFEGDAD